MQKIKTSVEKKNNKIVLWFKKNYISYIFLMPAILGFFIFTIYPVSASFFYSFTDYNGMFATKFGLFNFADIFDSSISGRWAEISKSFGITFLWSVVSVPFGMILSFSLSLFVFKEVKGIKIIRLLYYLPCIIPGIAISLLWADMFSENGLINTWLVSIGLHANTFFDGENTAFLTLLLTQVWLIGGGMIMWLAALNNIPNTLFESAKIDGAGYFRTLFKITIPMCTPIIFFNLVNAIIVSLQIFDSYAMVGVGPKESLKFINIYIYTIAFVGSGTQKGFACAVAWLLFLVIAIITVFTFKTNKWVYYGDGGNN